VVAAPGLSFTDDPTSGLYLNAVNDVRMGVNSADKQTWSATAISMSVPLSITGALSTTGVVKAGDGAVGAPGLSFGADTDTGFYRSGSGSVALAGNGADIQTWSPTGVSITKPLGLSGALTITGVASNTTGLDVTGGSGKPGIVSQAGTAAVGATPQNALTLEDGYLNFAANGGGAAVNPNKDVAFTNTITPLHNLKAWVRFTTNGLGAVTFVDGLNVTGVAVNGGDVDVTFASAFANTNYTAMGNVFQAFLGVIMNAQTTTVATIRAGTEAGGSINLATTPLTVDVWFVGRQ
jgi:hypothetical protein